jgi:hypothetical protein
MITNSINTPDSISVAKANAIIEEAYRELGITNHKGMAKELHRWFECSDPISKRVDGKVIKVVEIYSPKFIFGDGDIDNKINYKTEKLCCIS